MMYNQKMVVALKANGKVLREFEDTVYIPFGQEFSILLKNLNSVRALANISIDGVDVCPGGLVVDANTEINLERYITNRNLNSGNKFKFIERSESVEKHRGIKADDGIIRVSFKYEKVPAYVPTPKLGQGGWNPHPKYPPYINPWDTHPRWQSSSTTVYGNNLPTADSMLGDEVPTKSAKSATLRSSGIGGSNAAMNNTIGTCSAQVDRSASYSANNVGITVPGSLSSQTFTTTYMGEMEAEEHVIVLRILGETEQGAEVVAPVTVKTKPTCVSCGRVNKATAKFCTNCGTSLQIV